MKTINLRDNKYKETSDNKFVHNIKNNLFVISSYIEFGEYDKAKNKIKEICKMSPCTTQTHITNNKIIDSFINAKIAKASKFGIKCHYNTLSAQTLPNNIQFFTDMDICQAIGNAFDNAVDYLNSIDNELHKKIDIEFDYKDNIFYCKILNFINDEIEINNSIIKTSKENPDEHGFGITTMVEIVTKYSGSISFEQENNTLSVTLSFKIPTQII